MEKKLHKNSFEKIDILLVTYQRANFLEKTIKSIYERTRYPHRLIVIDNASTDNTRGILKRAKTVGYVDEVIYLPKNVGQCKALNEGFKIAKSEYIVTTQDDLFPPDLSPCWLERLLHLYKKYEPEYGAICMRIQRTSRLDWDENSELVDTLKSMPSVFRMMRKDDLDKFDRPFGRMNHWESRSCVQNLWQLKKKYAMATHLYADHVGYYQHNKGYDKGFVDYYTYSPERIDQADHKPYSDIDPKTNTPIKLTHPADTAEHKKRLKYWGMMGGFIPKDEEQSNGKTFGSIRKREHEELKQYCKGDIVLDIGCGKRKIKEENIGIDIRPYDNVDIVHIGDDLWFYNDDEVDGLVSSHCLEHFSDVKAVLGEWFRVLKPGGLMAFIVPDGELHPRTILDGSHKVSLNKKMLEIIINDILRHRIIRLENVPGVNKPSIICVSRKR